MINVGTFITDGFNFTKAAQTWNTKQCAVNSKSSGIRRGIFENRY